MNNTEAIISALPKWHPEAVRRAIRANFRCEYCDHDFLASLNDFKTLDEDHIIPMSAGGSGAGDNIAISCSLCNRILKQQWDPRTVCGDDLRREHLISAVRSHVSECRKQLLEEFLALKKAVYPENGS